MTYQPKCTGKMADYENLTLYIFLNSSQMCTYFCKDIVIGYCLYLAENSILNRYQIDFITHTLSLWAWCHVKLIGLK